MSNHAILGADEPAARQIPLDDLLHATYACWWVGPWRSGEDVMSTVKEKMTEVIKAQPDDASYEEIMRELAFERMAASGLEDVRKGRVLSNEEIERRLRTWQK